jgi:hypothetical protein
MIFNMVAPERFDFFWIFGMKVIWSILNTLELDYQKGLVSFSPL